MKTAAEDAEMQTITLAREQWQGTLDRISRVQDNQQVTIEVGGAEIGAQKAVENVPFHGITYSDKGKGVAIMAEGIELMVAHPLQIELAHEGAKLICIAVVDGDGTRHLVTFTPPLSLPKSAED